MDLRTELESLHAQVIREIDAMFMQTLNRVDAYMAAGQRPAGARGSNAAEVFDIVYPLSIGPGLFKGKKPTGVMLNGRDRIAVGTWKKVCEEILFDCNRDRQRHYRLLGLRGRILGKTREILSDNPRGMRSALYIDRNLYFESHYDTETLLKNLFRVLDAAKYDYAQITVAVRNT